MIRKGWLRDHFVQYLFTVTLCTFFYTIGVYAASKPTPIPLELSVIKDDLQLAIKWPTITASAIFYKNDLLWVLFNSPGDFDLKDVETSLKAAPEKGIEKIEALNQENMSGFKITHVPGLNPIVTQDGPQWILTFSRRPSLSKGLPVVHDLTSKPGPRVVIKSPFTGGVSSLEGALVKKLGPVIDLVDSDQQPLWVVFSTFAGRGIPHKQQYIDFALARAPQGLAIIPVADTLKVREIVGGIEIVKENGLRISAQAPHPQDESGDEPKKDALPTANYLYDFERWALPELGESFQDRKQTLQQSLVKSQDKYAQNQLNLKLARLYLSQGLGIEAEGYLNQVEFASPDIAKDRTFISLRALTDLLRGNIESARSALKSDTFSLFSDQPVWLGYLAAKQDDLAEARDLYFKKGQLSEACPPSLVYDIMIQWARALMNEYPTLAKQQLKSAKDNALNQVQLDEVRYYQGMVHHKVSEDDKAKKLWLKVAQGTSHGPQALARFALLKLNKGTKKKDLDQKIEELQKLSYALRSGPYEAKILEALGKAYFGIHDYRQGFNAWKRVITQQPQSPKSAELTKLMAVKFESLFLDDKLSIPPIAAAALFEEFKELTPTGPSGDKIIESLTTKLIQIELLKDASRILEHQVRFRLQGVDKAREGLKLAALYSTDNQPEKAMGALERSYAENLPPELLMERRYLKASLINKLGEPTKALEVLDQDTSYRANRLKGDILWHAGRFDEAAQMLKLVVQHLDEQFQKKARQTKPEDTQNPDLIKIRAKLQKNILNLALAYSLAEKKSELKDLRDQYTDLMKSSALNTDFKLATFGYTKGIKSLKQVTNELDNLNEYLSLIRSIKIT